MPESFVEQGMTTQSLGKGRQLIFGGKISIDEQYGCFDKRGVVGDLLDGILRRVAGGYILDKWSLDRDIGMGQSRASPLRGNLSQLLDGLNARIWAFSG